MDEIRLLELMNQIDDSYVRKCESYEGKKNTANKRNTVIYGMLTAAVICLVVAAAIIMPRIHTNNAKPPVNEGQNIVYEGSETEETTNKEEKDLYVGYSIKKDRDGRFIEITNHQNAKVTVESTHDEKIKESMIELAEEIAKDNIDFTYEVKVNISDEGYGFIVEIFEEDSYGFVTANRCDLCFNGEGNLYNAFFSYDDEKYDASEFIAEDEACRAAERAVTERYADFSAYEDEKATIVAAQRRDGIYYYIVDMEGTVKSLGDRRTFFSIIIDAVTGECICFTSNLN